MNQFGKRETAVMKGAAVLMMLIHHLFYQQESLQKCILLLPHEMEGLLFFAQMCKVCVALFVLLSGYGLYKSWENLQGDAAVTWKDRLLFPLRYIKKLLIQYWWAVIPLAVFGIATGLRPLSAVYGPNLSDTWKMITDLLGINFILYGYTNHFNITCWYVGVALGLYLIFPILYWMLKRSLFLFCGAVLLIAWFPGAFLIFREPVWVLPFAIGMLLARYGVLDAVCRIVDKCDWLTVSGVLLFLLAAARVRISYPFFSDGLLAFAIICVLLVVEKYARLIGTTLEYLGNHSANIFMTHTFFYHYYFGRFFYAFRFPALILLVLLLVCVFYSIMLEKVKACFHTDIQLKT